MSRMPSVTTGMDGEHDGREGEYEGDWEVFLEQIKSDLFTKEDTINTSVIKSDIPLDTDLTSEDDPCHNIRQKSSSRLIRRLPTWTPSSPYPRLSMDHIIPPPFYFPKTLYRPMREIDPTKYEETPNENVFEVHNQSDQSLSRGPDSSFADHLPPADGSRTRSISLSAQERANPAVSAPFRKRKAKTSGKGVQLRRGRSSGMGLFNSNLRDLIALRTRSRSNRVLPANRRTGISGFAMTSKGKKSSSVKTSVLGKRKRSDTKKYGTKTDKNKHTSTEGVSLGGRRRRQEGAMSRENVDMDDEHRNTFHREGALRLHDSRESFCHQCRMKTKRVVMFCNSDTPRQKLCTLKYCAKCLIVRYPHQKFDFNLRKFKCPRCEGYCNCTVCVSKRGEKYVSSKKLVSLKEKDVQNDLQGREEEGREPSDGEESEAYGFVGHEEQAAEDEAQPFVQEACQDDLAPHNGDPPSTVKKILRSCHQCKNCRHPYMKCCATKENGKRCRLCYCQRCLGLRYPDISFVKNGEFMCPRCSNTCTCKSCATRRKEPYVTPRRMRRGLGNSRIRPSSDSRNIRRTAVSPTTGSQEAGEGAPDSDRTMFDDIQRGSSTAMSLMERVRGHTEEEYLDGAEDIPEWQNHDEGGLPITNVPYVLLPPLSSISLVRASAKEVAQDGIRSKSGRMVKPSAKARVWDSHILVRYR